MGIFTCHICHKQLDTKHVLEKHKFEKHATSVSIGDTTVDRTENGYPCPKCPKMLGNPRSFGNHLKKHGLSGRVNFGPAAPLTPSTSTSPSPSDASPTSPSSSDASPTESPAALLTVDIDVHAPSIDDQWIVEDNNVSSLFHSFQLMAKNKALSGELTIEGHVQHLLALSGILLLKPGRTHGDLHQHLDRQLCETLRRNVLRRECVLYNLPETLKLDITLHVEKLLEAEDKNATRLETSKQLMDLINTNAFSKENRFILAVRNMVEKLPEHVCGDGPQETEFITHHLQSILGALFEKFDGNILLRWTSVSDDDKDSKTRPDASVNVMQGASLGERLGCGEVKPQYQSLNHRAVQNDLIRAAHLAKNASDTNKRKMTFMFLVVGNHMTFYLLNRMQQHLYTLVEVEHVHVPYCLEDIPLFLAQTNKIANILAAFDKVVSSDTHTFETHPQTLSEHQLLCIVDHRTSRKRKSISSHYNH